MTIGGLSRWGRFYRNCAHAGMTEGRGVTNSGSVLSRHRRRCGASISAQRALTRRDSPTHSAGLRAPR